MRLSRFVAATLLVWPLAVYGQTPPVAEDSDEGCPEQRITDYLDRHGDHGRIDPFVMLELSRQTKQALDARRFAPLAINGSAWRTAGPTNGAGRATSIALHPTVTGTAIIGAAGGGAWKTTDAGATWQPLTDDIPNLSVGAITYSPSDSSTVYLGTGEGGYAGDFIPGIGLLASNDGGTTWTLPQTVMATEFYRLLVGMTDPNEILAATNSGLLRSTKGQNGPWKAVISSSPLLDALGYGDVTDIVRDPSDAQTLYATTWDRRMWCARSDKACTPDVKLESPTVMKSIDGGVTWKPSANGLPVSTTKLRVNRMSIAIAPSSPQTLYVATSIFDNDNGREVSHIFKSTNGGATWLDTSLATTSQNGLNNYLSTQAWYGNTIVVSATDPNVVIAGGVIYVRTTDGGNTWTRVLNSVHVDVHDLRYDGGNTLWIANDGGIWTATKDGAESAEHTRGLVTRQFYDVANDAVNRNRIYGGQQDNGTIYRADVGTAWSTFSGADGFACEVVPSSPAIAFSTIQNGVVLRTVTAGSLYRVVERTPPYEDGETTPFYSIIRVDPNNSSTIYTVSYRVWKSTSAGDGWVPLPTKLTGDATWPTDATVRALAIAPSDSNILMVAMSAPRRRVFRTTNGGAIWTDVTNDLPPNRTILKLDIDPRDAQHVVAAIAGTSGPSVYITTNGGGAWVARATGLPSFSAQTVRFDPTDSNTIYAGTDVGVYRSTDGGMNWERFGTGMPAVSVYDIDPTSDGTILRAATHGRGVWELDISDTRNTSPAIAILSPTTTPITVMKGTTLTFTGSVTDREDPKVPAAWNFSDSWESIPVVSGSPMQRTFDRPGRYPVSLSAIDSNRAVNAQTIEVDVLDPADSCSTPSSIPGAGPFPYSVTIDTDLATKSANDPKAATMSCYPFTTQSSTWLTFVPATGGDYQFSLCGSQVSAVLAGYVTESCSAFGTSAICIARSNADADCSSESSTRTLHLDAGQMVRLTVANYFAGDFGPVTVTVTQNSKLSPMLTNVAPAAGVPGASIVIRGDGFQAGLKVNIGGVAAKNVVVVTSKIAAATVPMNAAGNADVTVSNNDGSLATLKEGFTFEPVAAPKKARGVRH